MLGIDFSASQGYPVFLRFPKLHTFEPGDLETKTGTLGTMWFHEGSEESAEHMVSKNPPNSDGFRVGIGIAASNDLSNWEIPKEFAKDGLGVWVCSISTCP